MELLLLYYYYKSSEFVFVDIFYTAKHDINYGESTSKYGHPIYLLFPLQGYVQGMSDLLSPILFIMDDEADAFWCFVGFMEMVVS